MAVEGTVKSQRLNKSHPEPGRVKILQEGETCCVTVEGTGEEERYMRPGVKGRHVEGRVMGKDTPRRRDMRGSSWES